MDNKEYRVLWLDDQIGDYSEFINGMEARNLKVDSASTVKEGLKKYRKNTFDLILVDLRMNKESGFDFLEHIRYKNDSTSESGAVVCVLSSYLHISSFEAKLNRMRKEVGTFDKDIPDPDSPSFDVFVSRLRTLIEHPPTKSPSAYKKSLIQRFSDPFEVTYKDYLLLPNSVKRALKRKALSLAEKTINEEFESGSEWVLLCGDSKEAVMSVVSDEIPANEKVVTIAMELDRAPYLFSAPDSVDDLWSGSCRTRGRSRTYPTVSLVLGERELNAHFDTGSPFTFSSYELLSELGLIDQSLIAVTGRRGFDEYEYINQPVKGKIVDQKTNTPKGVIINTRAIKGWRRGPYVVSCPKHCDARADGERVRDQFICVNRSALIGRNLVFDNQLQLIICGATNKTSIKKSRK